MSFDNIEEIIENFPLLSEHECALLIQNQLLEAIESDNIFEFQLAGKIISLSEPSREAFTKMLNSAIKNNEEMLAGRKVSDWLNKYLVSYENSERDPNTYLEFCLNDSEIKSLTLSNIIRLLRIFRLYDYFLVVPISDFDYPIDNIFNFPLSLSKSPQELEIEIRNALSARPSETARETLSAPIKMPLREILNTYPETTEQIITSGNLKLKNVNMPVRPSIRNWILDYTANLGQAGHSSMDRTNYLFRSENTRTLNSQEREKLAIILKSFDENTPLTIDTTNQQVVFEEITKPVTRYATPEMNEFTPEITKASPVSETNLAKNSFVKPYTPISLRRPESTESESETQLVAQDGQNPSDIKPSAEDFIKTYEPKKINLEEKPDVSQGSAVSDSSKARPFSTRRDVGPSQNRISGQSSMAAEQLGYNRHEVRITDGGIIKQPTPNLNIEFTPKQSKELAYLNPYAAPDSHETHFENAPTAAKNAPTVKKIITQKMEPAPAHAPEPAPADDQSPIKVKGYTERTSAPKTPQAKILPKPAPAKRPMPASKPPQHTRHVLRPHSNIILDGMPEPKINGNTVDLSGNNN